MQLQKINFKVRQHGSLKIEESVYIKNSIIFLLQSSNMEEIEHKDVYTYNKNIHVKSFLDQIENSMNL